MADYFVKNGTGGLDDGTSWANAAESIAGLLAAQAVNGSNNIYVHNTHNNLAGAAISWTLPEATAGVINVFCVDGGDATGTSLSGTTVGTLTSGAIEDTNGNFTLTINTPGVNHHVNFHGITFNSGAGGATGSSDIVIGGSHASFCFYNCTFIIDSTSTAALITLGATASQQVSRGKFENCVFKFSATGQSIVVNGGFWEFVNCKIDTAGSGPTTLFTGATSIKATIVCHGCDWTHATNVISVAGSGSIDYRLYNCAIGTPTTGTHGGYGGNTVEMMACDGTTGTSDIMNYYYQDALGVVEDDTGVYLTTGSATSSGPSGTSTPYSLIMTPSASVSTSTPLYTPWIYKRVTSTGDKTITIKVADTETDADELEDTQLWMEVEYMGEPGLAGTQRQANSAMSIMEVDDDVPLVTGTLQRDLIATGTDRTDTDEAWTGITETNTYTLSAAVNLADQGYIRCRVALALDTTNPVYVDPKIGVA